ncbi:hypothetical protein HWV62_44167 [Athelia sp. TMB]|nr:hypothetical protein HWV62_44167 [Athelia sp. TMB]
MPYDDRIIKNGPGMHLNLLFSAGGRYVEAASRKGAKLFALGPVAATEAIESYFGEGAARVETLDKSFTIWDSPLLAQTGPVPNTANSKAALKLKKLCGNILKYTDSQTLAYKCIVRATTRYIGLRRFFIAHFSSPQMPRPSQADITRLWRHDSVRGDQEWDFFLEYAAYCLAGPDEITAVVESLLPSSFGSLESGLCVSNRLLNCISTLAAVRYLAGILELPSFWQHWISNDLHSISDALCNINIRLLEDLATDCEERKLVLIDDLMALDPEGINALLFAAVSFLPLHLLPADEARSKESLKIAERLMRQLQTPRCKCLFPQAAERAERFLPKPEAATDSKESEKDTIASGPEPGAHIAPNTHHVSRSEALTTSSEVATPASNENEESGKTESGTVQVTVLNAQRLPMSAGRTYCSLRLGNVERKTKYSGKTDAPIWNERFKFSASPLTPRLLVMVKDHRTLGKDRLLGMAQVDVWRHLKNGERSAVDANFELTEAGQGSIYLRLEFIAGMIFICRRRYDKLIILNIIKKDDDDDDSIYNRPSSLLEHINAATRSTILGAPSPFFGSGDDGSNYMRAGTQSGAATGDGVAAGEELSRPAHARYSFDGSGEGELALKAGLEVEILDDRDPAWWYARDVQTGREGVVPASYLY